MNALMDEMPEAEKQFDASRQAILKKIESERITKTRVFFEYLRLQDWGLDYDYRKDLYSKVEKMTMEEFNEFFNNHIKGKDFTYLVMGNKENMNLDLLKDFGEVKELSLQEIYNY